MVGEFRATAYLIVRPADGLRWTAGLKHGFALVGVQRSGSELLTSDGETIRSTDEMRFLFPQDAERAVRRGIATAAGGFLVGTRTPALAVFPHLRLRNVPDAITPDAVSEVDAPGSLTERDSSARSRARPAKRHKRLQGSVREVEAPYTVAADADAIDVDGDPTDKLGNDIQIDEPTGEQGLSALDALSRATTALERGEVPAESDLEELAADPASMAPILERSFDLDPPRQMELADKAIFFLAANEDRELMFSWLFTAEERLIGKSDLLVALLNTWLLADGRGALGEIRKLLRLGAISLSQRKPMEVAVLLREAARTVGDADSLREAYESMAQAPRRARDPAALISLLQEVEDEEGPTQAELRAIGLPLLLQAFKVATDDVLLELSTIGERYIRGYLRNDPPNLASALMLEPILESAHDRAPVNLRPSIENALRDLRQAREAPEPDRTPRTSTVAVTYEELLKSLDGRSENVEIVQAAYDSARAWGKDGTDYLPALRDALEATIAVADRFAAREFAADGAVGAFVDAGQVLVPGESDTATRHSRSKKQHTVRNSQGQPVVLGPHLKFGQGYRLYLAFDRQRRIVYVGRIGDHLPGKKSKDRPRSA